MRLKTLEMSGFKSFVDRTVIQFEEGITGVVGPNGCGKSNIVDAIRWVMGEMSARHLRGSEMADVIFNGCATRPPVGMSQVFLTFDNADGRAPAEYASYSEIQIGRRLYRSGESEYFINKTPCRLKDIVDLFLGTGVGTKAYSIVEQGMVGQIVSARPEERRMLIEEAAGISKFKSRKEAALRKMESTRTNLARLTDILNELTRQINSLNRQAKKAERYQRVSEELRGRELALVSTKYRTMQVELSTLTAENERLREMEVSSSAELSGSEATLSAKRLALAQTERELDGVQQQLYRTQHAIKMAEAEIVHRTKERASIEEHTVVQAEEREALRERRASLDGQIEESNTRLAVADLKLAGSADVAGAMEEKVEALRAKVRTLRDEVDRLKGQVIADDGAIANGTAALEHLERRHIDITGRIARGQAEIDAIDKRREKLSHELGSHEQNLDGSRQLKLRLAEESESAIATLAQGRATLSEAEASLARLRDELSGKRSRLASLVELRKNLEGYRDGVRAVLARTDAADGFRGGILGTISEHIETDAEYEPAVGAVLGEKLQYVVVRSQQEGIEAINYLRQAACGRSSFIPLDVRAGVSPGEEPHGEGVVGPIGDFVRFADDYRQICRVLLSDVVLVEDLGSALELWGSGRYQKTFVTRDGCVVDPAGVVTGGSSSGIEEQLIAQKRKIKELEGELSARGGELTVAEGEVTKQRERVRALEEQVEELKRDTHGKELHLVGQERDLARLKDELARYEGERDRLTVGTAALAEELRQVELEQEELRDRIGAHTASCEEATVQLVELQGQLKGQSAELEQQERELIDLKVDLAEARERQASLAREIAGFTEARIEAALGIDRRMSDITLANKRQVLLGREIDNIRADLDLAVRSVGGLEESQRCLQGNYDTEVSALRDRELSLRELRRQHDEALSAFHGVELTLTEHRGQMRYLSDGIRERHHLDLAAILGEYARDDLDLEAEEAAVTELKDKIERIGPVNVDAIQEFDELSRRHEFLTKQNADLAASLDNLSKAIAKINRTSRQRFRRAFEEVDAQFQQLFPKLFQGGQARLMLTDEENLLETGVEIIAQPPGKKLQSITLLSGGEKALTAVALIFSIFLTKPSPFCLLDEVDAPLDDANVDRFNDLIRSMTPHSQFILITHNKRTMELADLLYGVTMQEQGVSTMVSVKLGADAAPEPAVA